MDIDWLGSTLVGFYHSLSSMYIILMEAQGYLVDEMRFEGGFYIYTWYFGRSFDWL